MKNKIKILVCVSCFFFLSGFAQSKKEIKELNIKSVIEITTLYEKEKKISYKSHSATYNKKGKLIEMIEYNRDGNVLRKEISKYDSQENKIEEITIGMADTNSKTNIKIVSKYDSNGNKIQDLEYDLSGSLLRKQQFSYDRFNNKKTETVFDANGKITKKTTYNYNEDGLRIERKEFNEKNVLVTEKKITYTFY